MLAHHGDQASRVEAEEEADVEFVSVARGSLDT